MLHRKIYNIALVLITTLIVSGCATGPETKYYLLSSDINPQAGDTITGPEQVILILGPVNLPEYLDRSQIVIRTSNTELDLSDTHRWAEPLEINFTRVLAENLHASLKQARVILYPTRTSSDINYQVTINVLRFDTSVNGDTVLTADWNILDGESRKVLVTHRSGHTIQNILPDNYPGIVEVMSETVEKLSNDIVNKINEITNRQD